MNNGLLFLSSLTILAFTACGGDSSTNSASDKQSSSSEASLPACTDSLEGIVQAVDNIAYQCQGLNWIPLNKESSSSYETNSSSSDETEGSSSAERSSSSIEAEISSSAEESSSSVSESLPICTESLEGTVRLIGNTAYQCENLSWVVLNGKSSSSSKANWAYLNPAISYGEFTDSRDDQIYKTVVIGTQTWMAENLNYEADSSWCPDPNNDYTEASGLDNSFGGSEEYCEIYGRLYMWFSAMQGANPSVSVPSDVRGLCPDGWHFPSVEEWNVLSNFAGDSARIKLSASGKWTSGNGTDDFGFAVLPAGPSFEDWSDGGIGKDAFFWTTSDVSDSYDRAYFENFDYQKDNIWSQWFLYGDEVRAMSIRCIKD